MIDLATDDGRPAEEVFNYHLQQALSILNSFARYGYNGATVTWDTVTWAEGFIDEARDNGAFRHLDQELLFIINQKLEAVRERRDLESLNSVVYPLFRAPVLPQPKITGGQVL